jgi:gliding motility-associated-like protein
MLAFKFLGFFLIFISFSSISQQLLINEISQGTNAKEYVEFIVAGNPTCQTPVPCADLRGVVIDDNNGYFGAGSNMGIASGAVRFANNAFWSCIPQGTIIVVYNNSDVNPALPANDLSMSDNNCKLVIPINSTLFEGQSTSTSTSITTYPASGTWVAAAGNWNQVSMNNSYDSFLTTPNNGTTVPTHGVSWGDNTTNSIIYFAGSASNKVFYFANTTNNNASLQANWVSGSVGVNETPGVANNTANANWIGGMNPQCGISNSIQLSISSTPTGCGATCTGTATVVISGGASPYTIAWSNGGSATTISNLCAATYTVDVTDNGGCTATEQIAVVNGTSTLNLQVNSSNETCDGSCDGSVSTTVTGGVQPYTYVWNTGAGTPNLSGVCPANYSVTVTDNSGCSVAGNQTVNAGTTIQDASITTSGPFSTNDSPVQFNAVTNGGTWSADCGTCITASGVFSPQNVTAGTYQICYNLGSGACASNDCVSIQVTQGCTPQSTSDDLSVCPGTVVDYNGQQYTQSGIYPVVFTDINNCDSTHTLFLNFYNVSPNEVSYTVCLGDSIEVYNNWYDFAQLVTENVIDGNGCLVTNSTNIFYDDCTLEDYNVFIPNVFTPNGDEFNNVFEISITGGMLERGFIVNRWGNLIHEFNPYDLTWDGTDKKGMPIQDGVYTYVVNIRAAGSATSDQYHGFVTVIR